MYIRRDVTLLRHVLRVLPAIEQMTKLRCYRFYDLRQVSVDRRLEFELKGT